MAVERHGASLRHVRMLFNVGTVGGLADGQLLERFATRDGEAAELAFAALVERHGPMVLRACRAILRDEHEAQDAFQATFLVLVRRAGALRVRDSLGPWLHQVAYRVAAGARSAAARRRRHERQAAERAGPAATEGRREDLGPVLHEELGRLPERYRAAIVLCCLEGLTREQAARRLGWPVGTVQSRLARGRQRLRDRLARRGLAPTVGAIGAALSAEAASAAVPRGLADCTVGAASRVAAGEAMAGAVPGPVAALSAGVLRMMLMNRLKAAALALAVVGGLAAGLAMLARRAAAQDQPPATRADAPPRLKFEIRTWRDGKESGEPVVVEAAAGEDLLQIQTPDAVIQIRPRGRRARAARAELDREARAVRDQINTLTEAARVQHAAREREDLAKRALEDLLRLNEAKADRERADATRLEQQARGAKEGADAQLRNYRRYLSDLMQATRSKPKQDAQVGQKDARQGQPAANQAGQQGQQQGQQGQQMPHQGQQSAQQGQQSQSTPHQGQQGRQGQQAQQAGQGGRRGGDRPDQQGQQPADGQGWDKALEQDRRLENLERKLDQILKALEGSKGDGANRPRS
jgi:RNA polymerase sigma factor (sigma-70 family)